LGKKYERLKQIFEYFTSFLRKGRDVGVVPEIIMNYS
jgi:hypothetical protein